MKPQRFFITALIVIGLVAAFIVILQGVAKSRGSQPSPASEAQPPAAEQATPPAEQGLGAPPSGSAPVAP